MLLGALFTKPANVAATFSAVIEALSQRCPLAEDAHCAIGEPVAPERARPWARDRPSFSEQGDCHVLVNHNSWYFLEGQDTAVVDQ